MKKKIEFKDVYDNWKETKYIDDRLYLFGFFTSYLGLYPAVLFIRQGVKANTITFISLVIMFIGLLTIAFYDVLLGASLIFLWFLLDSTDGHIARYCKDVTKSGHFMDSLGAYFIYGLFFLSIGVSTGSYNILIISAICSVFNLLFYTVTYLKKEVLGSRAAAVSLNRSNFTSLILYFTRFSGLPIPLLFIAGIFDIIEYYLFAYSFLICIVMLAYAVKSYRDLQAIDLNE